MAICGVLQFMYVYSASWNGQGNIRICDHEEYRFVKLQEIDRFEMPAADEPVLAFLKEHAHEL